MAPTLLFGASVGAQAHRQKGEEAGPVALGSGGERGPLWPKVELSLLGSGARTTSRGCAVLEERSCSKEGTLHRTVGSGRGQLRGSWKMAEQGFKPGSLGCTPSLPDRNAEREFKMEFTPCTQPIFLKHLLHVGLCAKH